MKAVVITGSRRWADRRPIKAALEGAELLIVGDANGADALSLSIAMDWDAIAWVYYADPRRAVLHKQLYGPYITQHIASDWRTPGSTKVNYKAGPDRNEVLKQAAVMARDELELDVDCYGFTLPGSVGTYDCMCRLRSSGFEVKERAGYEY